MKIVRIFDNCLFAFKYEDEKTNEFKRLFDLWNDPEYLEDFFDLNKTDLQSKFWEGITIEEAIFKTVSHANQLEKRLSDLSEKPVDEQTQNLDSLFEPLSINQIHTIDLEKRKAKNNWLRIYALRINKSIYLITGGAIKLTAKMQDREHTKRELLKLEKCRKYLKENGISDVEGIIEEIEM
jgi:hypothetical protein